MRLLQIEIERAERILAEKLGGVIDIASEKITLEEAVLLQRYAGTRDEVDATFIASVARGIIPGDVRQI